MSNHKKQAADKVTIKIPRPLYNKIADVIDGAGYNSVTDFVVYVMRDLVASHEMASVRENHPGSTESRPDDTEKVKDRLKALGYL